jgi:hypothetical protein
MRSISILALEIYKKLGESHLNFTQLREQTKQYILNEVTRWGIKQLEHEKNYFFKPKEFIGDKNSPPFEIRLLKSNAIEGYHELKFGNINAETDQEKFKWDDKDPYKLSKALFLRDVLDKKIKSLFEIGKIHGIMFQPYEQDGLADDRYSYFYNMYSKLGKDKYDLDKGEFETEGTYFITPKF